MTAKEIEALVVRMATENRAWGYLGIQGALSNLGHELARSTIANILKRNAIEPAPERARKTTWKEFLTQHRDQIVAADFFTVEVWTVPLRGQRSPAEARQTRHHRADWRPLIALFSYGFVPLGGVRPSDQ